MILVVSHLGDPHAQRVIEHLRTAGREVVLLDLGDLPARAALTLDYEDSSIELRHDELGPLDLRKATSVWWRRPQVPDTGAIGDEDVRLFTVNEWNEAIAGLWQLMDHAAWVNHPVADEVAARKALQLKVATEVGLRIPRTLITSDPQRAREFIETVGIGRTIHKTFSCTHAVWRETRLVRDGDLGLLDAVRLAPVIFQEYVPAGVDVRITMVGNEVFAAAIDAQDTDYPVDFRMSLGQSDVRAHDLPAELTGALRRLMARLGLVYGAIDVRRTGDGDYVFFEINTAGEFLFVEERTGQLISKAMADVLAAPRER